MSLIRNCSRTTAANWRATTTTRSTRTTIEVVSPASQTSAAAASLASTRTPNIDHGLTRPAVCLPCRRTTGSHAGLPPTCWPWRSNRSSRTLATGSIRTTACHAAIRLATAASTRATLTQASTCVHWGRITRRQVLVTSLGSSVTLSADYVLVNCYFDRANN